ncbi:MAG: GNAT family N-acetyltransferase [Coriobacteriia bacterium]|nr:GNAT family N-acetyltransferase [Coriobacteriia bacterium]
MLPAGCGGCAFWESAGERERRCGSTCDVDLQHAWHRRVTDEWGDCGRVAYEDDEILGFVKYAPSRYFPQASVFHAAPSDPSVPIITCLHISPDARHRGLGTVLLRAALRDLVSRGERRVEAFAFTDVAARLDDMPMPSMQFLARNGFRVSKADPLYPLLKLDLRSLVMWQDNLESVLESLLFPLRAPKRAPASWIDEG